MWSEEDIKMQIKNVSDICELPPSLELMQGHLQAMVDMSKDLIAQGDDEYAQHTLTRTIPLASECVAYLQRGGKVE